MLTGSPSMWVRLGNLTVARAGSAVHWEPTVSTVRCFLLGHLDWLE